MSHNINRVAVIGAGTMGAAIAAHAANAGLPVLLLDIVPRQLTPEEEAKGLSLDHPAVRNRIARSGLERIAKLKPASFMSKDAQRWVEIGNLEDDLERLAEADWIVEAVIEKLDIKRQLMVRIDAVRDDDAVVTTNTSGLPIDSIIAGCSDTLRQRFFGTHFFNPPRYMKLLEVIAGAETDPQVVEDFIDFARRLGKGVVVCKDKPNFIGNRILSVHGAYVADYALAEGYRFEEVDALTGPLIGRPKTATFRLQDLVGIDVAHHVAQNLHDLIPEDDYRDVLHSEHVNPVVSGLLERGWLGNKSRQGFYKKSRGKDGKSVFEVLDPATYTYEAQQPVRFEAVGAVRKTRDLGDRLQALFDPRWADDRGARLAWATVSHFLAYAAARAQEIAFDLASVDNAIRWGFSYELGPFELWDRLGVAATATRMKASEHEVAPWVEAMLAAGCATFYRYEDGRATAFYDWQSGDYAPLERDPRHIRVADVAAAGERVAGNDSASIRDLDDGVMLLEFHTKMNAIDFSLTMMMREALSRLETQDWQGLVIGNDGENFCVGANLVEVLETVRKGDLSPVDFSAQSFQEALQGLRYAPKPVVTAVHGMALGGGAEVVMGVPRVVAAAESYIGLVEVGVGLVPAGGGLKELVRRLLSATMATANADPLPTAQRILETVSMAKVSTSAAEARDYGFLAAGDRIVMNRDHLLYEAKQEVLRLAGSYAPPVPARLWAGGRDLFATLQLAIWSMAQAGYASEHDALVAERIGYIISGGDLSAPQWVDEDYILGLEREAFLTLLKTEKTQARIQHMLETGKPLRN